ncbi:MAG: hypothetical protein IJ630_06690 [Treponema sp.]|nr:hypothetical protein [Treponema sp.]
MESVLNFEEADDIEELEPIDKVEDVQKSLPFRRKVSRRLPPLLRLTRRATVFLSLTLIATILFFMTGNRQGFLDSNLSLILTIIASIAISLTFFSGTAIFECIFFTIKDKKFRLIFHLISYILIFLASLVISILSLSINLLSEGIDF